MSTYKHTTGHCDIQPASPRLSELLPGAGYVRVRAPGERYFSKKANGYIEAKGKEPIDAAWQTMPITLEAAMRHSRAGGNVGLLCGHGGYIVIDLDKDAAQRTERIYGLLPHLAGGIRIYRDNSTERCKLIVRIDGDLPDARKNENFGIEILSTGNQAVIVGTHHTGAVLRFDGTHVPVLTAADVALIWKEFTGETLEHRAKREAGEPDDDAVRANVQLVGRVLGLLDIAGEWREYDSTGRKIILDRCPFNPADNPHENDSAAAVMVAADGTISATCHHARCQQRIHEHRSGWGLLKQIAGYTPAADVRHTVDAIREFYRNVDLADFVPVVLQSERGYMTRDNDTKTLEGFCQLMGEQHRYDVTAGFRLWATKLGCSIGSVRDRLARVAGWCFTVTLCDDGAATYTLTDRFRRMVEAWHAEFSDFSKVATFEHPTIPPTGLGVQKSQLCICTHTASPAFAYVSTPLTMDQVIERANNGEPYAQTKLLERRLASSLPSLGPGAMLAIDALQRSGGTLDKAELAGAIYKSKWSISRIVDRLVHVGLCTETHYTVSLIPDWQSWHDLIVGLMPPAAMVMHRELRFARESLERCDFLLDTGRAEPEAIAPRRKRAMRKLARAEKKMATLDVPAVADDMLAQLPHWTVPVEVNHRNPHNERTERLRMHHEAEKAVVRREESKHSVMDSLRDSQFAEMEPLARKNFDQLVRIYGSGFWLGKSQTDILGLTANSVMTGDMSKTFVTHAELTDWQRYYVDLAEAA